MSPAKIGKPKTRIPEADVAERADFCDDPNGVVAFKFYESVDFHFYSYAESKLFLRAHLTKRILPFFVIARPSLVILMALT